MASKKIRPVLVEWDDAATPPTGWSSLEEISKEQLSPIHSVGYLIFKDKTRVVLCGTIYEKRSGDLDGNLQIVIPRSCITKITRL